MRPKLISRMTFRLPEELETDILAAAQRRSCSANEIFLSAMENELSRTMTYRLNYYAHIRPLVIHCDTNLGRRASDKKDGVPR